MVTWEEREGTGKTGKRDYKPAHKNVALGPSLNCSNRDFSDSTVRRTHKNIRT